MALKKLGRGLDVLISRTVDGSASVDSAREGSEPTEGPPGVEGERRTDGDAVGGPGAMGPTVVEIDLDRIDFNPNQPRKSFEENDLEELSASVAKDGILQPILVRRVGDRYELIAGERRVRAARRSSLQSVPAIIVQADTLRAQELALIENVQRTDLSPIELAEGFRALVERHGLTQEDLAKRIGKRRSTIANTLRLLELPEEIQASLARGEISAGHAKIILSVSDAEEQLRLFRRIRDQELTVRDAEAEADHGTRRKRKPRSKPVRSRQHGAIEERLMRALGTKVAIRERKGRGAIEIEFYSREELERLIELLAAAR